MGVSSPQFDDGARGFSYNYDARLDMRMNQEASLDAHYIVNHYSYEQLVEFKNWLTKQNIKFPFVHQIQKNECELLFRSKNFETYDTAFKTSYAHDFHKYIAKEKKNIKSFYYWESISNSLKILIIVIIMI